MKNKQKKAFTLIELLIVIAIIGILFIVLVSKVDFATDKAKATGVQTDFRSFQLAFEQVAKENAGFNTFGWDEGDTNGDHVRNSYDVGDTNKDGVMDPTETWTGRKQYTENWTGVYTLVKPGTNVLDADAIFKLESAINKNLDPKLHITIGTDGTITMANQAQDPWKTEYVGKYLTNASAGSTTNTVTANQATADNAGGDRGAIIIYSKGANQELGCVEEIVNGSVIVTVLKSEDAGTANKTDNNVAGKDDYSLATIYTYKNGYGEVISTTTGFSNNQTTNEVAALVTTGKTYQMLNGANQTINTISDLTFRSEADFNTFKEFRIDGQVISPLLYSVTEGSTIITLKKAALVPLDKGSHTVEIVSTDGVATTQLEMNAEMVEFSIWNSSNTFKVAPGTTWADWLMSGFEQLSSTENKYIWIGLDNTTVYYHAKYQGLINTMPIPADYILYDDNSIQQKVSSVIKACRYAAWEETCCFDPGSQVLMADGTTKNIEDVKAGDMVMSLNETTGEFIAQRVAATIIRENSDDLVYVHLSNGVTIGMRAYHPLLTTEGYKSLRPEQAETVMEAGKVELLEVGDVLVGYGENVTIVSVEVRPEIDNYNTYNLSIEGFHNYIVNGIVAHNATACPT